MRSLKIWLSLSGLLCAVAAQTAFAENIVALDRTFYQVNENAGTVAILVRVTRDATAPQPITVAYATADGSAIAGADYQATSGTLTFGPNDTVKVVQVPIIDDLTVENTEQFTFTISNPTGADDRRHQEHRDGGN